MDAVHNQVSILKIALLVLAVALLLPALGNATTSFVLDTNSVALVGSEGGRVNVSSSDGSTIQFQAVVTSSQPWLSVNGQSAAITTVGGLSTPTPVTFQAALSPATPTATVTLQATSPAGVQSVTINVTYSAGGGCTVNCGGGVTINANPSVASADNSTNPTATVQVTLSTSSTTSVPFTIASASPATWLTVTTGSSAVVSGTNATLTLSFNSAGMAAGSYSTTVTVDYGSSSTLPITVNYTIIASTVVTLSPTTAIWAGSTSSTPVTVVAGTPTMTVVVNTADPWIRLTWAGEPSDYSASALYGVTTAGGFIAKYNSLVAAPATGTLGTVTVSDANGHSAILSITYNGVTNPGGGSGTVTLTPNPATMSTSLNAGCCVQTNVTVNSTVSGAMTGAISGATCTNCFSLSTPTTVTTGTPATVAVTGNPSGLATGTYTATLTVSVTPSGTTTPITGTTQVSLVIGGGNTSNGGAVVAPTALTFAVDANNPASLGPAIITVADPGTYTASVTSGSPWLTLGGATGTSGGLANPQYVRVVANGAGMSAGSYTGGISIQSTSGTTQVSVSMTIYTTPTIYASINGLGGAGTVNVLETAGNLGSVPQLYIFASDSSAMNVSASIVGSPSWLQLNSTQNITSNTQPQPFSLAFTAANLPNGLYTAQISFTTSTAQDSPLTVPVVLAVSGSSAASGITLSQSTVNLNAAVNGASTQAQLGVNSSTTTSFTATATVSSGSTNWLSVTPSGLASTTTSYITVTANPAGLSAGTYYGTVTVAGGGSQASAQVVLVVSISGGGSGNVVSSPTSLSFTYQGGTLPASQNLVISNQVSGTGQIAFTVATSVNGNVANWLSAAVNGVAGATSGQTQGTVAVTATPGSLPAGNYTGTVIITPTGGNVLSIPVSLSVQGTSTVTASPLLMNFSYQLNGTAPAPQAVQVSGSAAGLPYSVTVTTINGTGWLQVNKTSGSTPDVLSVSVSAAALSPGVTYTGTVTVQGTGTASASNPVNISVTLTVTAPYPTITLVQSAASLANGPTGMVSPGEIVTIFGTGLGPATALQTALDPTTHKVSTNLGGVQVLFNGYPAPLTYVSATQINCVVPYELAQLTSPYVQVRYGSQGSNDYNLTQATTAPGIFTVNAQGSGQGAILNFDSTYNGTGTGFKPAAAGSVIQVYMTGEGQTSPAGVTGKVTCPSGSTCTIAQLPVPLLPVAALVNNQPASIVFWGEAPGLVSGVMQVNLIIPPGIPSGPASLVIKVGSVSSQTGVTIAVQ